MNTILKLIGSVFNYFWIRTEDNSLIIYNKFKTIKINYCEITKKISTERTYLKSILHVVTGSKEYNVKVFKSQTEQIVFFNNKIRGELKGYFEEINEGMKKKLDELISLWNAPNFIRYETLQSFAQTVIPFLELNQNDFWQLNSGQEEITKQLKLINFSKNFKTELEKRNESYIDSELIRNADLFDSVEKNPLTYTQRRACVIDEKSNLVLAGAGSGKTSVMVARCAYLIRIKKVHPSEILILAYNKSAAEEVDERIKKYIPEVEIKSATFHSLGKQIIQKFTDKSISVTKLIDEKALKNFITNELEEIIANNSSMRRKIFSLLSHKEFEIKSNFNFNSEREYLKYIEEIELRTLQGEEVKSFGELSIANHLFQMGIPYIYENKYEHKTTDTNYGQYIPDFYLPDHAIYIEYFGLDNKGKTPSYIDEYNYKKGIEWKKKTHKQHKTIMIELFYSDLQANNLLKKLEIELAKRNIFPSKEIPEDHFKVLNRFLENFKITTEITSVLGIIKTMNKDIKALIPEFNKNREDHIKLTLAEMIINKYQSKLDLDDEIDFNDMIIKSTQMIKDGRYKSQYSHILVDEFQDISPPRAEMIRCLRDSKDGASLFCVGDDWQAIYHFAGSASKLTREFEDYFGPNYRAFLDTTFRFNDKISKVATRFVTQNPQQIKKDINTIKRSATPKVFISTYRKQEGPLRRITAFLDKIKENNNKKCTVLFLHKENMPLESFKDFISPKIAENYPNLNFSFMTFHKSKGLEADYVIALGLNGGTNGFPNEKDGRKISLDQKINPLEEDYPYAEERRIFYVVLTRAKEEILLLSDLENPSPFITELVLDHEDIELDGAVSACPQCERGFLVKKNSTRANTSFLGCTKYSSEDCNYSRQV